MNIITMPAAVCNCCQSSSRQAILQDNCWFCMTFILRASYTRLLENCWNIQCYTRLPGTFDVAAQLIPLLDLVNKPSKTLVGYPSYMQSFSCANILILFYDVIHKLACLCVMDGQLVVVSQSARYSYFL